MAFRSQVEKGFVSFFFSFAFLSFAPVFFTRRVTFDVKRWKKLKQMKKIFCFLMGAQFSLFFFCHRIRWYFQLLCTFSIMLFLFLFHFNYAVYFEICACACVCIVATPLPQWIESFLILIAFSLWPPFSFYQKFFLPLLQRAKVFHSFTAVVFIKWKSQWEAN